jgi:mono/diheme cytochrome c family protein
MARTLLFPVLLGLAACGGNATNQPQPTTPRGPSPAAAAAAAGIEAKQLYESLCFTCHGSSGRGDGPGAAALDPKPRSFADAAWQDATSDEQIHKAIVYGGAAVGKSPMMPGQPQLKDKAAVLDGLVRIVRNFQTQ